jgi:hypothetical protein
MNGLIASGVPGVLLICLFFGWPVILWVVIRWVQRVKGGKHVEMRQQARRQLTYQEVFAEEAAKKAAKDARRQKDAS